MSRNFTLVLPAPDSPGWEVWRCPASSASVPAGTLSGTPVSSPGNTQSSSSPALSGRVTAGLPVSVCRTFSVVVPPADPRMARALAFAQLEKRGLAGPSPEETAFESLLLPRPDGGAVLTVDVVPGPAASGFLAGLPAEVRPSLLLAPLRGYAFSGTALVLLEEQGHLVLAAVAEGCVLHTQLLPPLRLQPSRLALEIRLTLLTLQQEGLLPDSVRMECAGGFSPQETASLEQELGLPVITLPRPVPQASRILRSASPRLLPPSGRAAPAMRRGRLKALAAAAALALALLWWAGRHREVLALENRARELEAAVEPGGTGAGAAALQTRVRQGQERWQSLRMALDSRRYPMIHLDRITRCLGDTGVVLTRFESKGPELAVSGTAQSATEAYTCFSSVTGDAGLRLYEWSMAQPAIGPDGSADFQMKGKMR